MAIKTERERVILLLLPINKLIEIMSLKKCPRTFFKMSNHTVLWLHYIFFVTEIVSEKYKKLPCASQLVLFNNILILDVFCLLGGRSAPGY